MAGKFVISLTCAKDDTDRATVAFVVANAAVASDKQTVVFLSTEGTRLSQKGYADDIHEQGFAPPTITAPATRLFSLRLRFLKQGEQT